MDNLSMPRSQRHAFSRDRWAIFGLLILPLALSLPCLFGYVWAMGDLVRQFYPWKELGRQALASGHLPLWDPYVYCGMPLLGNFQSGLAYPPHLPFYFLPFAQALGWHLLFHFFMAGLGFYVGSRGLGLGTSAAFVAALIWQSNSFLLARVEFMSALSAYAWTPWILSALALGWRTRWAAAFIALQALAGYPLELGYTLLLSAALVLALRPRAWKSWILACGLGLAAGALVLLPGLELWRLSSRAAGGPDASSVMSLQGGDMLAWVTGSSALPWPRRLSLDVVTLALLFYARGSRALFAWALFLAGLALSFGLESSLGLHINRHPGLALVWCSLALAFLAGLGFERLLHASKARAWIAAFLGLLILGTQLLPFLMRNPLAGPELLAPSPGAQILAAKMSPGARLLLSPEVQNERAFQAFPVQSPAVAFLQANTSAPLHLHDANGYDPLAPAAVVGILNQASFGPAASQAALEDELGVEALVGWDPSHFAEIAISRRPGQARRAWIVDASGKKIPVTYEELNSSEAAVHLGSNHPAGRLVVNDTWYPGWQAEIDGKAVAIEKEDGAFRAVSVNAGDRELTMHYRPASVEAGAAISALALIAIFVI
jgi:hypothetical protein